MTPGSITALVETLVSVGATPEMILAAVRTAEAQKDEAAEQSREKARNRVQKWREKRSETSRNVTERSVATTKRLTRGEDNLQDNNSTGEEGKKEAAPKALSDLDAFRADLEQDATPEQVEAFIKHRRAKKGQNSAYSAKLFRRDAADCGLTVSQAIDTAVGRGWLTVKPEYLKQHAPPRASAPPSGPRTVAELAIHRLETGQSRYEPPDKSDRRLGTSYGSGQAEGPSILELVAIAANQRSGAS